MTFEEAKDQVAKDELFDDWTDFFGTMMKDNVAIYRALEKAANLFATAKAAQETESLKREVEELKASEEELCTKVEKEQKETVRVYDHYEKQMTKLQAEINSKAAQAWEEGLSVGLKAFNNDSIPHNPYLPKIQAGDISPQTNTNGYFTTGNKLNIGDFT